MITRKIDEEDASPAGFTYTWVKKIGGKLDKLYVITWQKSNKGNLPEDIKIESLPRNKLLKIIVLQFKLLAILSKVDGIFCHQNPEYTILAAPLARIFRKKIVSWYTHKAINWRRRLMELLTDKILTASDRSFLSPSFPKKVLITGHGINTERFKPLNEKQSSRFVILSIGRISPVKGYEILIKAIDILAKQEKINSLEVRIVGGLVLKKDEMYFREMQQLVKDKKLEDYIKFLGPVPHNKILSYYQDCDLFVNLSQTGSVDKAVLEAMACQKLVLTSNEAFRGILKDERLLFEPKNAQNLSKKIIDLMNLPEENREKIDQRLRKEVIDNHNLDKLVKRILASFNEK